MEIKVKINKNLPHDDFYLQWEHIFWWQLKLAKWYYSQTNVISDGDNEYYLRNKESFKDLNYNELLGTNDLLDELNKLSDEKEQLKQTIEEMIKIFNDSGLDYMLSEEVEEILK